MIVLHHRETLILYIKLEEPRSVCSTILWDNGVYEKEKMSRGQVVMTLNFLMTDVV